MGLLKNLIVTGASSLQGPVSFLGNERHNTNSQYSASSNLYFAGGTTYFINNVGSAKFNTLTTTGSITVGTTAAITGVTTIGGNTIIGANSTDKYANLTVHGNITAHDVNVNINGTSTSLKEYVSNGKDLVADAITGMGVATKTSATSTDGLPAEFSTLAENISKISPTVSSDTEISVEITSCTWERLTNTVIAKGSASSTAYANINGHNENTASSDAEGTKTHICTLSHTISGSGNWSQRGQDSSKYTWSAKSIVSENKHELNTIDTGKNTINLKIAYVNAYSSIVDSVIQHNVGYIHISSSAHVVITDGNESTEGGVPLLNKGFSGDSRLNLTHTIEGNGSWNGTTYGWSATSYVKEDTAEKTKVILSGSTTVGGDVSTEHVLEGYTFSSNIAGREVAGTMPNRSIISNAGYYFNDGENYAANMLTSLVCKTVYNTSGESQGNHLLFSVQPGYYDPDCLVAYPLSSFGNAEQSQVLSNKTFTSSAGASIKGTMPNRSDISTTGYYVYNGENCAVSPLTKLGNGTVYDKSGASQGDNLIFSVNTGYYNSKSYVACPLGIFGNVEQSHVLANKTFTSSAGVNIKGTMPDRSTSTGYYSPVQVQASSDSVFFYINTGAYLTASASGYAEVYAPLSNFGNVSPDNVVSGKTFTSSAGYCTTGAMKEIYLYALYGDNVPMIKSGIYRLKVNASGDYWYYKRSSNIIGAYSNGMGSTSYTETLTSTSSQALSVTLSNSGACVSGHPFKKCARYNNSISLAANKTYKIVFYLSQVINSSVTSGYPLKCVVGLVTNSSTLVAYNSSTDDYMTWPKHSEKITTTSATYIELTYTPSSNIDVYPALLLLSGVQTRSISGVAIYVIE